MTTAASSARRSAADDLEAAAPFVPWAEAWAFLRAEFRQGEHAAIIGPTGTGKTHIAFELAELRGYVIVVACKPRDPLILEAKGRGYHLLPGNKLEVPYVDGKPLHRRIIYWPRLPERAAAKLEAHQLLRAERALQKPLVGSAIGYVRKEGHWALMIDEGTWVCRDLNLQRDVDSALFSFRSLDSSLIILGQRPSWMGRYVLSQPTHLFLFNTADTNDRKALGDIAGVDTKVVQELVRNLDRDAHEVLYVNTRRNVLLRTIAPAR